MLSLCCCQGRTKISHVKQNRDELTDKNLDIHRVSNSSNGSKDYVPNGGSYVRNGRRSLPDVVLPSTGLSTKCSKKEQPSILQLDAETGRRPTLVMETAVSLAQSESTGLEDTLESLQDTAEKQPLSSGRQTRAYSLDTSILRKVRLSTRDGELSEASRNPPVKRTANGTHSHSKRKRSILHYFLSRKNIHNLFNRRSKLTSEKRDTHNRETGKQTECADERQFQEYEEVSKSLGGDVSCLTSQLDSTLIRQLSSPLQSTMRLTPSRTNTSPNIRRGSLCLFSHADEPIVTPFAQILAGLRRVRYNFIQLTNVSSTKDSRFGISHAHLEDTQTSPSTPESYQELQKISALETLEELEWCLDRLEGIQTHRSVSDMATSKFRKMLSKELNQFSEHNGNSKQISEYICSTFLDTNEMDTNVSAAPDMTTEDQDECMNKEVVVTDTAQTESRFAEFSLGCTEQVQPMQEKKSPMAIETSASTTSIPSELSLFGVTSTNPAELDQLLNDGVDKWGIDIFELSRLTPNPLTCLFYRILQKRGFIKRFCIPEMNLIRYITAIEEHYRDVPYHNRVHAADVLQSTHVLLNAQALSAVFTELEILSILFASAIHDVDHPGVTNQFLINTNDQLAILYNDTSVLENHHLAIAFQVMTQPGCDLFENVPKKKRLSLRRMTIDMVLATDMSKHMSLLADLKTMVETEKVAGTGILALDNYSDRIQILQSMIHCADLSNPTKPLALYRKWNARVMEEHFGQGDQERARGLELSPMCDRTTASIEKSQVSFIDYIVHPLWEAWSELVHPDAQDILETLDENREWYQNQLTEEHSKPTEDKSGTSHD